MYFPGGLDISLSRLPRTPTPFLSRISHSFGELLLSLLDLMEIQSSFCGQVMEEGSKTFLGIFQIRTKGRKLSLSGGDIGKM